LIDIEERHHQEDIFDRLVSDHRHFSALARRELKRSERYCSFLSLIRIRMEELDERLERKFPADESQWELFRENIAGIIRSCVRSTDVVSDVERGTLGLLLVETPSDGAETLSRRLRDSIAAHFKRSGEYMSSVGLQIEHVTFPSPNNGSFERILSSFSS
jgi:GGDEF domain-containing protein